MQIVTNARVTQTVKLVRLRSSCPYSPMWKLLWSIFHDLDDGILPTEQKPLSLWEKLALN